RSCASMIELGGTRSPPSASEEPRTCDRVGRLKRNPWWRVFPRPRPRSRTGGVSRLCERRLGKKRSSLLVRFALESGQIADIAASLLCAQKRTSAPQKDSELFDHLVGADEQRRREFKPKCLRGLLLILNLRLVRSSRDELLAAVDVVRRARECCVAHDVNGQGGDVSRSDDAADRQRRPELVAPLVEVFAED